MSYGPDDEEEFLATQDLLLERFARWLAGGGVGEAEAAEAAGDASLALDWKWGYGDGELGLWRAGDVAEFLLQWCPRKLSASAADSESIPDALGAFIHFLDAEGLLAPGSAPAEVLGGAAGALTEEFLVAMDDPSNFGMAKSLFAAAGTDGVDIGDPDQLQEWLADFNDRPEQERRQLIPDTALAAPRRPALPPVVLPDEAEVAASRAAAPILGTFAAFAAFVGEGRKLTQTGQLTLADARALVDELGTGDLVDPAIGDRTFKTKSSAELPGLRQVFAWARKAGVVRVARGRVIATKQGLAIAWDPAAFFDRSLDAILALGPLASQREPSGWFAWPEVNEVLDRFVVHLLAAPYAAQGPVPIEDLADVAAGVVLDSFEFHALGDEEVERRVASDIVDIMDTLEGAGVVRRTGTRHPDDDPVVSRRRHGGSVELTPAGAAAVHSRLIEAGYDTPRAGRFAEATATELFLGTDLDDFPTLWAEVEAWLRRREPVQAAAELATAVRELQDPALRNLALAAMADMDAEAALPEVRKLSIEPEIRGFALCWLVDQGHEEPEAQFDPDDVSWFVDVLAYRLVTLGPEGLCDTLALAGGHDDQVRLIDRLWRSPSAATDEVLAAMGEEHPSKTVAKAARKARFKRRGWLAGTG